MIVSFRDGTTESIFNGIPVKNIHPELQLKAFKKLRILNSALVLKDLQIPPGNKLEKLKGVRKDSYSIRVDSQWRITFRWSQDHASEVKFEDYH